MNGFVQYILHVTAAAILTAVTRSIPLEGSMRGMVKLVGGVFMALTLISPLLMLRLPDMEGWINAFGEEGRAAAASGEAMADEAMRSIIKERTEAYILDKAAAWDTVLTVEVETNDAGEPTAVTLRGSVSHRTKTALAEFIASELGIGKEAQRWIS